MTRSADHPLQILSVLACFQMIVCGGLYVPWHLGLVAAPSVLGAQGWLVHEIQFGTVPLLAALSAGGRRLGPAATIAIAVAWLPGRLVATFVPEPSVLLAAGAAAMLPAMVTVLATKTARPLATRLALAGLAAAAVLLHWEVWRYGTADSAWLATSAGTTVLLATAARPVPRAMLLFLVVGLLIASAGVATGSLALQRAAQAALALGLAAQAMPAAASGVARWLFAASVAFIVAGLALPGAVTALVAGWALWLSSAVVTTSVSGARGGAAAGPLAA